MSVGKRISKSVSVSVTFSYLYFNYGAFVTLIYFFSRSDVAEGKNESKPLAIFNFYHTSFHLSLLSLLQFKKDVEPLRSDNYETMSKREFSTSLINPFTANLIAIFYKYVSFTCTLDSNFI